jgi:ferric-dicitrate binding protein FerR (iron transport regulator)
MNYYQFTAEDLAADDSFKAWVCAPTPEAEAFWSGFLREFPERYYQVGEARLLVTGLHRVASTGTPDEAERVEALWHRIEATRRRRGRVLSLPRWLAWSAAACLALLMGLGWWAQQPGSARQNPSPPRPGAALWVESLSAPNQLMQIQLADGSVVRLSPNSRLRYRKAFSGPLREVYLTGEAFFEVRKNPKQPFVVYANGLVTKVLGTSFRIRARAEDPTVTVAVRTGRVSVYPNQPSRNRDPELRGLVLSPNQKVIFHRAGATMDKTLVEHPSPVVAPQELRQFLFEDAPAARVFEAIERAYGVDVVFDEEMMADCTLTINLTDEDLFQKLTVICRVLDAHYKIIDAQVVIYGKGCH